MGERELFGLADLRKRVEENLLRIKPHDSYMAGEVLDLSQACLALLQALEDLVEASEGVHIYPEGSVGLDDLATAEARARKLLDAADPPAPERRYL